jgi:hypothetical protein
MGQLPYLCDLEEAGIPTMLVDYEDQDLMVKSNALKFGVPGLRFVSASRTLPGPADAARLIQPIMEGLTTPLTDEEKKSGVYRPNNQRVLFEGTTDEAEEFFAQTQIVKHPMMNCPISLYTDGLPIVLPTEERVAKMLKGTSHKPDEVIRFQANCRGGKKGDEVTFLPKLRTATVERVAVNAVMAGCKPEHLPVVLAIAESGVGVGTTVFFSQWACVSGPIVKEIGMNSGVGMIGPGSPVNSSIGRTYQMMAINIGGAVPGINRMNAIGSPFNVAGVCFAEATDGLPPGWKGLNEEHGFKKTESVVLAGQATGGIYGAQFSPGGYRSLQRSGHGGMARRAGVKGTPGPHNWLEYLIPSLWAGREGGFIFIMVPEMAKHLYDIGFKTKDDVYKWLYEKSKVPLSEYRNRSWPDESTNGWLGVEGTSGKRWKELSDDYMVPMMSSPSQNCIIVAGGEEEVSLQIGGGRYMPSPHELDRWGATAYSIDAWK